MHWRKVRGLGHVRRALSQVDRLRGSPRIQSSVYGVAAPAWALDKVDELTVNRGPDEPVFTTRRQDRASSGAYWRAMFVAAAAAGGVRVGTSRTRSHNGSWLVPAWVALLEVAWQLGHSTNPMAVCQAHLMPDNRAAVTHKCGVATARDPLPCGDVERRGIRPTQHVEAVALFTPAG